MQNIIQIIIKTRFLAVLKGFQEQFLILPFFDIYKSNKHMTCFNFCQQYKNHFIIAISNRSNYISFPAFFFQDYINFC